MSELKNKKVALIQGGMGAEREVSLSTGKAFEEALIKLKLNYIIIDADETLPQKLIDQKPDIALLALHGKYAEDGVVQGLCEYLKIPYTGSGLLASALCMSKLYSKQMFQYHQIPTPGFVALNLVSDVKTRAEAIDAALNKAVQQWGMPLVVKPSREGSSVGISICERKQDLIQAVELAAKSDRNILIEHFIKGKEVTVTIFKDEALTPIEISPKVDFYNYENKYTQGNTDYFIPARFSEDILKKCQELSLKAAQVTGTRSYCRVDLLVDKNNETLVLEVNTLPGATPTSLTPQACKFHNILFEDFIFELLNDARLDYENLR